MSFPGNDQGIFLQVHTSDGTQQPGGLPGSVTGIVNAGYGLQEMYSPFSGRTKQGRTGCFHAARSKTIVRRFR